MFGPILIKGVAKPVLVYTIAFASVPIVPTALEPVGPAILIEPLPTLTSAQRNPVEPKLYNASALGKK